MTSLRTANNRARRIARRNPNMPLWAKILMGRPKKRMRIPEGVLIVRANEAPEPVTTREEQERVTAQIRPHASLIPMSADWIASATV